MLNKSLFSYSNLPNINNKCYCLGNVTIVMINYLHVFFPTFPFLSSWKLSQAWYCLGGSLPDNDLIFQHRVAQETILYKDEQLREAQAWIARVQEMDVLQSNTNHSLQAELRERTEQYNQLWLGCQRQVSLLWDSILHIYGVLN